MIKGKLGNMMKQAQKMQEDLKRVQDELANLTVVGEASSGKVKVTLTCNNSMEKVIIEPSLFSGKTEDLEVLEDLVKIAVNDGLQKAKNVSDKKMASVTAGIPLPPGF